jgi:hypothetical protein
MAVYRRNHQTLGQELMHIRRVDAANGSPITIRSATVGYLLSALVTLLSARALRRSLEKQRERFEELKPELGEMLKRRDLGDEPVKSLTEGTKFALEHNVMFCGPPLIATGLKLVVHLGCVFATPKQQGLADLIAGIATVSTDEPTAPWPGCHQSKVAPRG